MKAVVVTAVVVLIVLVVLLVRTSPRSMSPTEETFARTILELYAKNGAK